jgi:hypothetical protein
VAAVLGFVGLKILGDFVGLHVPTDASLVVVARMRGGGVAASLLLPAAEGVDGGGKGEGEGEGEKEGEGGGEGKQ